MSETSDKEKADLVWAEALEYLTAEGWVTHVVDSEIADRLYRQWLRDTDEMWANSGYRDRDLLRAATEETFVQHYGEEGGMARFILFSGLLEIRARREGRNQRGEPRA